MASYKEENTFDGSTEEREENIIDLPATAMDAQYLCTACNETFDSSESVESHVKSKHGVDALVIYPEEEEGMEQTTDGLQCTVCDEVCADAAAMKVHMRSHTGEKTLECEYCHKKFVQRHHLVTHMRTHTGERPFHCSFCDRAFATKDVMVTHERSHTGERPFLCEVCGAAFADKQSLVIHQNSHFRPYECATCERSFAAKQVYEKHMKLHEMGKQPRRRGTGCYARMTVAGDQQYSCDKCLKVFNELSALEAHKQTHKKKETDSTSLECSFCPKVFSTRQALQTHLRVHTGERPYQCPTCGKRFVQIPHLQTHIRTHTGERPYECRYCQKTFSMLCNFRAHELTHSTEKPHICNFCGKAFSVASYLKLHVRRHKVGDAFICIFCNMHFSQWRLWNDHLKVHLTEAQDPREQQTAVGDQSVPKIHFALAIPAANLKRSARLHHHHDQPHVIRETDVDDEDGVNSVRMKHNRRASGSQLDPNSAPAHKSAFILQGSTSADLQKLAADIVKEELNSDEEAVTIALSENENAEDGESYGDVSVRIIEKSQNGGTDHGLRKAGQQSRGRRGVMISKQGSEEQFATASLPSEEGAAEGQDEQVNADGLIHIDPETGNYIVDPSLFAKYGDNVQVLIIPEEDE